MHVKARKRACDNFQIHAIVEGGGGMERGVGFKMDFYEYLASLYTINCLSFSHFKTNIYY